MKSFHAAMFRFDSNEPWQHPVSEGVDSPGDAGKYWESVAILIALRHSCIRSRRLQMLPTRYWEEVLNAKYCCSIFTFRLRYKSTSQKALVSFPLLVSKKIPLYTHYTTNRKYSQFGILSPIGDLISPIGYILRNWEYFSLALLSLRRNLQSPFGCIHLIGNFIHNWGYYTQLEIISVSCLLVCNSFY